ncbi:GTPase [Helicobacter pylori]|uniref:GTPase n=1 Tax=Helicobacter pylori TaxID=210 RepID=UPI0009A2E44E|nr:GTPase [Helicobacter pylori]NHA73022.1 GTPase [Helicobacter pylori]OPG20384.1 GTPase [Helicobacter pylori]QEF33693.1 GTPase [Helicobacter pylori]
MKDIYLGVEKSIKELQSIFKNTDDKDEKLKRFNQEALKVFQQLEFKSLKELESLKNNEEWENFTIAFYGETGAGKSTLIECLRLFFKERSKMDQQERFRRLYAEKNHRGSGHALLELEKFQDGAIIGDGRSDFTLKTQSYSFQYNHQNFILLDVPGIEGDEKKVIEQISNATQKAHAIFYVTKTPNPPQKGEEGKEGTIEKIQKQLDLQTEVWTIFNKPINSPRALKDGLINESEKESLKILNKKMKNILGEHYKGYKAVSAQAAFYGLSQALIPETDFYEKKQKFLKDFKAEELLYQSHFKPLAEFIAEELLKNSRAKIIESNCNKALKVVEQLQKAIKTTIEKRIDPGIKETQEHLQEARYNLDRSKEKFISDLKNSAHNEIDQFKSDLREKMYAHINKNIEDDECKEIFKNEHEQRTEKLRKKIGQHFNECKESFIEEIKKDIEQFKERIKDSLIMLDRINIDSGFDFSFNIDSGINKIGLFSSIGGLVLLFLTPIVGEFALFGGLVLGAIGIVKSVWGFFDSDYKRSQQKKEVDKNLHQICEKIAEDVKSRLESRKKDIWEKIGKLKANLRPVDNYKRMKRQLKEAHERLGYISNSIHLTISKQGACNEE